MAHIPQQVQIWQWRQLCTRLNCIPSIPLFPSHPLRMPNSDWSVAQTIIYLRPQTQTPEAIEVLNILANSSYVEELAPSPEPVDIPLGGIPDLLPTTHLSPYDNALYDHGRVSRESTPGLYTISCRVIRLGFESVEPPSSRGSEFGARSSSDIILPYYGKHPDKNPMKVYFRIHYNLNSGALLITALDGIMVGSVHLKKQQSLLLMAGTRIHCGGEFGFTVEFPDTSNCAEEHERNFKQYAADLGFPDARYLPTPRVEYPLIGAEHRSIAILGKGSYGEVHKAELFAIKILEGKGEREMKEVNILSRLCHVSLHMCLLHAIY